MRPSNRGTHSSTPIRVIGADHRLLHLGTHSGHDGRGVVVRSGSSSSGGVAWTVGQSVIILCFDIFPLFGIDDQILDIDCSDA